MSLIITSGYGPEGGGGGFVLEAIEAEHNQVALYFSDEPTNLTGDAADVNNWILTGPGDFTLQSVAIVDDHIVITVLPFLEPGGEYNLEIPDGIVAGSSGYGGEIFVTFTCDTPQPTIVAVEVINERTIEIIYNNPMDENEATDAQNYDAYPLTILSVASVTATTYRLTTSKQTLGQQYTLTASNIHDIYGNLV